MKISLLSAGVAAVLTVCALLLGQNASDLAVPGARYVAATSHGFDALAGAGKSVAEPARPDEREVPASDVATPVDDHPAVIAPQRSKA